MPTVTCFGEVLWDVFPAHKTIGGAPLNVALRLKSFGVNSKIISSVGNDGLGKAILDHIHKNNIDASIIQIDMSHKTGTVNVTLDKKGSATYEIAYPVAWDKIEANEKSIALVKESDAFIFGSLACRDDISKKSLFTFLEQAKFKVFDVNLRPPFYSLELLIELMNKADFIKFNDDEISEICTALEFDSDDKDEKQLIKFISKTTKTNQICVTKGKDGAILFYNDKFYMNSGYPVKVIDTVGAGDSFLASLITKLLFNTEPNAPLNFACAVGALVASKKGANSEVTDYEISQLVKKHIKQNK